MCIRDSVVSLQANVITLDSNLSANVNLLDEYISGNVDVLTTEIEEVKRLASNASLHEVTIYTNVEDDEHFFEGAVSYGNTQFGDIWINANTTTRQADGTLSTRAIHRWQNSLGGFANTGDADALAWRNAPNDAFGNIYLASYAAQNVADRKTLFFWDEAYGASDEFGPNVAIAEDGTFNPNPRGDLWLNTSNDNIMYVYLTNTSFETSHWVGTDASGAGGDASAWAQTMYYSNDFNKTNSPTGWYDGQDLNVVSLPVSYTHLTLPTNREV